MYRKEKLGTLCILAIFAAFMVMTGGVNEKCQTYPYFVCGIGIFLTALNLGLVIYKEKKAIPIDVSVSLNRDQFFSIVIALIVSFVYIFLVQYVGYFTMTFLFVAGFSYWHSRDQKKWMYFAVAAGVDVVVYIAFKIFLRVPLPTGFLI